MGDCPMCGCEDLGFELPDERERILMDLENKDDADADADADVVPVWATVRIVRTYYRCPVCEARTLYKCRYRLSVVVGNDDAGFYNLPTCEDAVRLAEAIRDRMGHSPEKMVAILRWERDEADYLRACAMEMRMGA